MLAAGLARLFAGERRRPPARSPRRPRCRGGFAVVAGGPGTGKTTTVARIVALLAEQAAPRAPPPLVALAAPTGKAAARLEEAVHDEAAALDVADAIREQLLGAATPRRCTACSAGGRAATAASATTARNRLPHDVVIVDETSMVSLSLMARLRRGGAAASARLVLVGDPGQLASIEAGAVLGDIVGPRRRMRGAGARCADGIVVAATASTASAAGDRRARPRRSARGDADAALAALRAGATTSRWIDVDVGDRRADALAPVRERRGRRRARGRSRPRAAGDAARGARRARRVPRCSARTAAAPHGVATWTARIEALARDAIDGFGARARGTPAGRCWSPRTTTGCGSTTATPAWSSPPRPDRVSAAFERRGEVVEFSPAAPRPPSRPSTR